MLFRRDPSLAGKRYDVKVTRTAPQAFRLHMGDNYVDIVGRKLNDGGLLIQVSSNCPPVLAASTCGFCLYFCTYFPTSMCVFYQEFQGALHYGGREV